MSYVCDWSVELPVIVGSTVVAYASDVYCVLSLDERGDLWKVGFRSFNGDGMVWAFSGPSFDVAKEDLSRNRESIMELCGIPSDVRCPPVERPEYTGPEYRPTV